MAPRKTSDAKPSPATSGVGSRDGVSENRSVPLSRFIRSLLDPENFRECASNVVQTPPNGRHRATGDRRDLLSLEPFHLEEHEHESLVGFHAIERLVDLLPCLRLAPFERRRGLPFQLAMKH